MKELVTMLQGDWIEQLKTLPDQSAQCCVTSPPYWGLRDYGVEGQLGLEKTPQEYVDKLVTGFREVWRVLRDDGTLWLNLGDCYATGAGRVGDCPGGGKQGDRWRGSNHTNNKGNRGSAGVVGPIQQPNRMPLPGLKPKDLVGIPWRVAFSLQADGWYLRSDIIWSKPNPMPESVTDRPTKSHEYIFLLSKCANYFYDSEAVKEPCNSGASDIKKMIEKKPRIDAKHFHCDAGVLASANHRTNIGNKRGVGNPSGRNKRTVWTEGTSVFNGAHFATFPPSVIKPCILAGSAVGQTIVDPFAGSGTTGQVALELGRKAILIELNPDYIDLIRQRTSITPGLALA